MGYSTATELGWVDIRLSKESIDFLSKIVKKGEENYKSSKDSLVGNISNSFDIEDEDGWFYGNILSPTLDYYMKCNKKVFEDEQSHFRHSYIIRDKNNKKIEPSDFTIELSTFWANYQKKHEFNPMHNHSGLFSFVIWLKIPYEHEEQCKLPFLDGIHEESKNPGEFQFFALDAFGKIKNYGYRLGKEDEGRMMFFPSELRHCVYPFYKTDENRVSISGNLNLAYRYDVA